MATLLKTRKEIISEVVERWNKHQSASQIAMDMSLTRNTVIGIANRAKAKGLISRDNRMPPPKATAPALRQRVEPKPVLLPPPAPVAPRSPRRTAPDKVAKVPEAVTPELPVYMAVDQGTGDCTAVLFNTPPPVGLVISTDHDEPPPPAPVAAVPCTLIDAPLFTCRVVVGQNADGKDLYCCAPVFRHENGKLSSISCCDEHKPRMFSSRRKDVETEAAGPGAIDRLSTTFKREKAIPARKRFTYGKETKD